ncbi:MAG: PQQ-dependent sugar dehydrogenase [Chloroflexota bacterium]|nr:PQQ-dependent sugar dehydrogenase [Chloroflexota bacterium]
MKMQRGLRCLWLVVIYSWLLGGCGSLAKGIFPAHPPPATTTIVGSAMPTPFVPPFVAGLELPQGFEITVIAKGLQEPRMMALGPDDLIYVAEMVTSRARQGRVSRFDPQTRVLEEVVTVGLRNPSGLAFDEVGNLYVANEERVVRYAYKYNEHLEKQEFVKVVEVVISELPAGRGHSTRTIVFTPDYEALLVSVGSSCNVCLERDERRAAVLRYPATHVTSTQGITSTSYGAEEIYVSGVRNAVGLAFRPGTEELWLTNCERTWLGDELPTESIYKIEEQCSLGWPGCHVGNIVDPDFGDKGACRGMITPAVSLPAHVKPLGLEFYTGTQFPVKYRGDLFVALSGSWSRSTPQGYALWHIPVAENGEPEEPESFVRGWLRSDRTHAGRLVDVVTGADGSLYISDDENGFIYQLSYQEEP